MTVPISNVPRRVVLAASGTGPYSFNFEILAATDIAVYEDDTLLTLTTDYTVTINTNGTGSVTLTSAATGSQITIVGDRSIARATDFTTGGDLFASSLNEELDQQTIFNQQNAEAVDRALKIPLTDPVGTSTTLPKASVRANKYLGFDSSGNLISASGTGSSTPISTVMEPVVTASTLANARSELGIAGVETVSGNVTISTNNTERMRITSSGNVGIGTSSPSARLHVYGGVVNIDAASGFGGLEIGGPTGAYIDLKTPFSDDYDFRLSTDSTSHSIIGVNAIPLVFWTNTTERMRITAGGEVYIAGTTDQGAYNLQVNGTGVWGAGAYVNGSDARIKEDVAPIESGLDVVEKLNPVTYRYKEDWSKDQSIQPGFIAQELLTALEGKNYVDGVVTQGGAQGYYSVAYQNLIPVLTKAIQEQQEQINQLKAEVAALKGA